MLAASGRSGGVGLSSVKKAPAATAAGAPENYGGPAAVATDALPSRRCLSLLCVSTRTRAPVVLQSVATAAAVSPPLARSCKS